MAAFGVLAPPALFRGVDNNGNSLNGGKLFTYQAGTTTKLNTYTDNTMGTPNANPVVLNTRGEAPVWLIPGIPYKFVLSPSTDTDPPTNAFWTVDQINSQSTWNVWAGTSGGSSNAYTATVTGFNAYAAPFTLTVIASFANTGAATMNVNGQGAKNIFKPTGSGPAALVGNEIQANQVVELLYDGTQFNIISAMPVTQQAGTGTATYLPGGVINVQTGSQGNGADQTEDTLFTYTMPANTLSAVGKGIRVTAYGTTANTADNKQIRIYLGGSVVYNSGSAAFQNASWFARYTAVKSASNAQQTVSEGQIGSSVTAPVFNGTSVTDTSTIVIKVTAQNNSAAAANAVVCNCFIVEFLA